MSAAPSVAWSVCRWTAPECRCSAVVTTGLRIWAFRVWGVDLKGSQGWAHLSHLAPEVLSDHVHPTLPVHPSGQSRPRSSGTWVTSMCWFPVVIPANHNEPGDLTLVLSAQEARSLKPRCQQGPAPKAVGRPLPGPPCWEALGTLGWWLCPSSLCVRLHAASPLLCPIGAWISGFGAHLGNQGDPILRALTSLCQKSTSQTRAQSQAWGGSWADKSWGPAEACLGHCWGLGAAAAGLRAARPSS